MFHFSAHVLCAAVTNQYTIRHYSYFKCYDGFLLKI